MMDNCGTKAAVAPEKKASSPPAVSVEGLLVLVVCLLYTGLMLAAAAAVHVAVPLLRTLGVLGGAAGTDDAGDDVTCSAHPLMTSLPPPHAHRNKLGHNDVIRRQLVWPHTAMRRI